MSESCFHCHDYERSPLTTNGVFCTRACEEAWVKGCLDKLSGDEIMEVMAAVMSKTSHTAERIRELALSRAAGK